MDRPAGCLSRGWAAKTTADLGLLVWVYRCVRLCLSGSLLNTAVSEYIFKASPAAVCVCACVRASPGFSPPATELDLNSGTVRGDREGDQWGREVKKHSRTAEEKKAATCSDKGKKERRFWLPPWCNVW